MSTALVKPEASAEAYPVAVTVPPQTVYNYDWGDLSEVDPVNDGKDGWSGTSGNFGVWNDGDGSPSYCSHWVASASTGTAEKTFTGLVVGRTYTFEVHAQKSSGTIIAWISTSTSVAASVIVPYSPGVDLTHTFTATTTSETVRMNFTASGGGGGLYWSNLSLTRDAYLDPNGTLPFPVSGGTVTLDESWSPYAQASVDVPLSDLELLERIDPRQAQRVVLTASETIGGSTRTFDLGLRARTVDHKAGKATLELASDEALLFDRKNLATAPDRTPRQYEASLRGICEWALGQVPGVLRNLDVNPKALFTGSGAAYGSRYGWTFAWVPTGAETAPLPFGTLARFTSTESGTVGGRGVDSYGNQQLASPGTSGIWTAGPQLAPGEIITISRYVRMNLATPGYSVVARFHDGAGNWVGGAVAGDVAGVGAGSAWVRPFLTVTVPTGAKYVSIRTQVSSVTVNTGSFMDLTGLMITKSDRLGEWREQALLPGPWDADMTAQWDAENLLLNPHAKTDSSNWVSGSGSTAIAWSGGAGSDGGPGFIRATQTSATGAVFLTASPSNQTANPGDMHTASVYVRHSAAGASAGVRVRYLDANNAMIKDVAGALVPVTNTGWTRISATAVAPANTARVTAWVYFTGSASGRWLDLDQAMLTEGPVLLPYFDGDTTDTANYTYSWDGTANASASQRVATPQRLPELFNWTPGQSLNDFLKPLLEASGLVLFCDEQRAWRLIDPTEFEVPGFVVVQAGHNATEGSDTISRNTDEWGTGVLIIYRWTDTDGIRHEAFDVAGTPEKVITIERESEYPGPGAAAYFLNSRTGRGRVQEVTALVDYTATPGNDVSIDLPGTLKQVGKVRRVTFGLSDGLMDLGTRGLTDTLPGSWAAWDPDQTWTEVDPALKWKDA